MKEMKTVSQMSGLMLLQQDSVVKFREGKAELVHLCLQKLRECADMKDAKVLICSEDCPKRYFADWHSKFVKLPTESDAVIDDPLAESFQAYSNIMELGVKLHEKNISAADLEAGAWEPLQNKILW